MKSKTWSCDRGLFSAGLFRKNLSRFWPLWGMASFLGLLMPLAVQVHHAVCDGFHLCQLVNELQARLDREEA